MALNNQACGLLELDPDRRVIAQPRVAQDRLGVDAPVHHSSFGRCIPEDMIELIGARFRREERLLLLGKEAQP